MTSLQAEDICNTEYIGYFCVKMLIIVMLITQSKYLTKPVKSRFNFS